jgi:hypothetical protein
VVYFQNLLIQDYRHQNILHQIHQVVHFELLQNHHPHLQQKLLVQMKRRFQIVLHHYQ